MEATQDVAYSLSVEELCDGLEVDLSKGLSSEEVEKRREIYGFNELEEEESTPLWKLVLEQFDDLLVKILLLAAIFSFCIAYFQGSEEEGITAYVEPVVILVILVLNAIVGVWQESNAESALEALKQLQPREASVLRDGVLNPSLSARELVPGDVLEVKVGDKIPADCRLTDLITTTLRSDQSALTGESVTVLKQTEGIAASKVTRDADKINMLFSGTTVTNGKGKGVVVWTGMRTAIGQISAEVNSSEDEATPLKKKLDEFGELLAKVIGIICVLVWLMNYKQFSDPIHGGFAGGCIYYLKIAVALGVAAIPEGLPAVITLCLALGTRRMVKKNAIIRHLPSVETLGCTTVICSDKTGTLTLNEMTAVSMVYLDSSATDIVELDVEGTSYNPAGKVVGLDTLDTDTDQGLVDFQRCATVCNDSKILFSQEEDKFIRHGEPTEAALKVLAEKMGLPHEGRQSAHDAVHNLYAADVERHATLEFSRGRKSMSVIAQDTTTRADNMLLVKGAPEGILERCTRLRLRDGTTIPMSSKHRAKLLDQVSDMARRPLRVLALACKEDLGPLKHYNGEKHRAHSSLQVNPDEFTEIESYLVFLGLVGIKDPARPQVKDSIKKCKEAGIRVMMITGDNQETAEAIATEIGIFNEDEDINGKSFTGHDFMALTHDEKKSVLMQGCGLAFSRTDPKDKKDIVELLKEGGEIAAMTGDGVNDAPALKAASIGIAMGIAGTAVAKESSKMVLADDNFATIVSAIEEGRAIYSNMKAFIRYLISSNIGEVASIFLTAALGLPEGLIPVQLLWVNLVTDGPPATALGFNPSDPDCMKKKPRSQDDQLINGWVFFRYMVVGLYVGFATVGVFAYWYMYYDWAGDGHTLVTFQQLSSWGKCPNDIAGIYAGFKPSPVDGMNFDTNPCDYFVHGKKHASTLSLSVLVLIEMLNALNALSEDGSLLVVPPWCNPYLLLAIAASLAVHMVILYIPFMADIFSIVPLTLNDWYVVWLFSLPVILIDEVLKFVGRNVLLTNR